MNILRVMYETFWRFIGASMTLDRRVSIGKQIRDKCNRESKWQSNSNSIVIVK